MVPHHCKLNKSYPPSRHYTKHGGANRTFYLSRVYGYGRACSSLWDAIEACVGTQRTCTRSAAKTCWHMPSPVHPRAYPKARKESRRPMNQKETGGMFHGIRLVTYEPSLPDRPHRCQGSQAASGTDEVPRENAALPEAWRFWKQNCCERTQVVTRKECCPSSRQRLRRSTSSGSQRGTPFTLPASSRAAPNSTRDVTRTARASQDIVRK